MLKHKRPLKITRRTSSVTNGFVQAILPDIPPTKEQRDALFAKLGIDPAKVECVYCGDKATDWDHLRPLVRAKRPTGYLTDHLNLVPACGRCNQSKGGQDWQSWMMGPAVNSPASRRVSDLPQRIERLHAYEKGEGVSAIDFPTLVGDDVWDAYWESLEQIERLMFEAQKQAEVIRKRITAALTTTNNAPADVSKFAGDQFSNLTRMVETLLLDGRLGYADIILAVRNRWPDARTSARSIGSVAAAMRRKGVDVPLRKR